MEGEDHGLMESSKGLVDNGTVDRKGRIAEREKSGRWKAAGLIFGTELCERMASLGLQRNLVTFFVNMMNISNPKSANMVSNFTGTLYLTPFVGGFMADAYLGRFWTIIIFAVIQVLGMVLLTLSASLSSLRPPPCISNISCRSAHGVELAVLFAGLYLIALGNGGIKPNVSSFGADQFDEGDTMERQHMPSFFNWFYFIISIGSLLSVTVFVYIQDSVGFGWGFGIPTVFMVIAIIVFFAGAPLYRYKLPSGSPLTHVAQVVVAAARKRKLSLPSDVRELYDEDRYEEKIIVKKLPHSNQFRFLDKAAVITLAEGNGRGGCINRWHLCPVTQVEDVKMILRVLPIWASTAFVWTALSQMETFSVEEGTTMDRKMGSHFQIPAASLSVFELVNVLLVLPLYDHYFVPFARKFTGYQRGITTLQRIGTGIVFSILAMVVAGIVEVKRINVAKKNGLLDQPKAIVPISIFWLVPQYFFRGTTEIFTQIGQLEFFYNEAPNDMRSLGTAMYLSTIAVGHFLSSVLVSVVNKVTRHGGHGEWLSNNLNRSKLHYFYWLLAGISTMNFVVFLICAHWYRYKSLINVKSAPKSGLPTDNKATM